MRVSVGVSVARGVVVHVTVGVGVSVGGAGVNVGGSVHVAGVPVGRVDGIRVDPTDFSAIVTMRLLSDLKLPTDSMASIKTTGLIGDKFILLSPGADETYLEPGALITMTESSVDIESLIGKMAFGSLDKDEQPANTSPVP